MDIEIIDNQEILPVDQYRLEAVAQTVLAQHAMEQAEIHVLLVDNVTIHGINFAHLQHDYPTDVITFPMNDPDCLPPEYPLEGEIVISTEMACEMAELVGWEASHEIELYLIHGLLHLCGYDDLEETAQQQMRRREYEMLQLLEIETSAMDTRWTTDVRS